jgi:1-acyl-sn-glycerol-3-phosphate acyltransferase
MIFIRSFLFHFLLYTGTVLIGLVLFPALPVRRPLFVPKVFTWYTRFLLKYITGLDIEIEGLENIPKDNKFLIVSNHQSAWETLIFFTVFKDPVMILKKELLSLPLFGWFLKSTGMIALDRKKPSNSFKTLLRDVDQRLKEESRPVCIFPEGTRKDAAHSFGFVFVEGQFGSVSASDVNFQDWSGLRSQVRVGIDTPVGALFGS